MRPPVRLVALDLAGVVCQYDQSRRLEELAAATGLTAEAVHARVWEAGLDERMDRGEIAADAAGEEIRAALGVALSDERLRTLWATAFVPDPVMLALVDYLAERRPTALLTNNGPLILTALDHELEPVGRRFSLRGFSCRYGARKPDPEPYLALAAEAGVRPEEIAFFDDSEANVAGARAVGLDAHRFTGVVALRDLLAGGGL